MLVFPHKPYSLFLYAQNTAMKAIDILNRLQQMNQLIQMKATGNPKAFAARIGISKSMLYNYLELLKAMGGPIKYSQAVGSYYYEHPVSFEMGYRKKNLA